MAAAFVDTAKIFVAAGHGGNGAVAFHREKYVANGGPDGGDGGRGGNVIFVADPNLSTLMDFRYKRKYVAPPGADGSGNRKSGRDGQDLIIRVPQGTVLRDPASGDVIQDMSAVQQFVAAHGGRGGWGNHHFATPTRQAPRFAKAGLPGQSREILLELKLLADVGLVGFPNVGKSTLLSVVSNAHPKIANYHFTTLMPNLGVVYVPDGNSFVIADIPGIIEGASHGAGLGHDFLRHIDRCRLLVHLVDVSGSEGRDPVQDFDVICAELQQYSPELAQRPMIVCGNKSDVASDPALAERLQTHVQALGFPYLTLSAATHLGVRDLIHTISAQLASLPPVKTFQATYTPPLPQAGDVNEVKIQVEDHFWFLEAPWLEHMVASTNFDDFESRNWFDRQLRAAGLFDQLENMGIQDGDTVVLYDLQFEYQK